MANFAQVGAGARRDGNPEQQGVAFDPFASHQYSRPAEQPAPAQETCVAETSDVYVTVPRVRQVQMHYAPVAQAAPQQSESIPVEAADDTNFDQFAPEDEACAAKFATPPRNERGRAAAVVAAVGSLALVAGIGFWGYNLIVRDVSDVPVITAIKGPMRVAPEVPGGRLADHQGLAVNAVAANGTAAAPADTLQLAPAPITLTADDRPTAELSALEPELSAELPTATNGRSVETFTTAETKTQAESETTASEPLSAEERRSQDIDALVASLTDDAPVLSNIRQTSADDAFAIEAAIGEARAKSVQGEVEALRGAPGVKSAPRPQMRPATFERIAEPAAAPADVERDVASLAIGTRMAQLGAYESGDVARSEWVRISAKFVDFFEGKQMVVQRAESGGRIFYRLRVVGFDDLADARRFCSALVAGQADCIPVVMR
ncbi:MAG: SPOR domain-containing protein [Epibacterium sp.]|nr:SPOR domain-containing protein [Epibacterium sp.]NQX72414.1 SPOR domain-containing protein [Epibacterium sp.]